jgi:hypothetical protein
MSTANYATSLLPMALPPRYPTPLSSLERQPSPTAVITTPAALEFASLEAWLTSPCTLQLPLHQIESQQNAKGREVQRLLLQSHLQLRGDGDVGPALRIRTGEVLYTRRRRSARGLKTIFGPVEIHRMGYCRNGAPTLLKVLDQLPLQCAKLPDLPTHCAEFPSQEVVDVRTRLAMIMLEDE